MKTFATLALLGFASAIKLQTDALPSAEDHADALMKVCDTNLDGKCELSELHKALEEIVFG